jgi:tripartite-type tricarboxylate transporter receptor subunit TctC
MDTIARAVAPRLSERLGQPVVVQNQAGASGNIGSDAVAKSAPDGHTLLITANTMLMATQMTAKSSYNPVTDFAPVGMTAYGTFDAGGPSKTRRQIGQ